MTSVIDRRRFLVTSLAGVLAAPLAGEAQHMGKVHQIGLLPAGASVSHQQQLEALREGLREPLDAGACDRPATV
jgi:hypothetical protein